MQLNLEPNEVQYLMQCLADRPLKEVFALFSKIEKQLVEALQPAHQAPPAVTKDANDAAGIPDKG